MDLLWNVLEEELRDTIEEKNDLLGHIVVTFRSVWTIFESGILVSTNEEGHDRVFKLKNGAYRSTACGEVYTVELQYVDFDREKFGLASHPLQIMESHGTKPVEQLRAFLLKKYHDDHNNV